MKNADIAKAVLRLDGKVITRQDCDLVLLFNTVEWRPGLPVPDVNDPCHQVILHVN